MKILKSLGLIFLLALIYLVYSGTYFDIPRDVIEKKYAKGASSFLNLENGARLHYRDEGEKNKTVILLLHGFNGSLFNFENLVPHLKASYRVVTLDLPGFGLTGSIPQSDYSLDVSFDAINALMNHLEIDTFSIGGNSMGGGVAWRYAVKYPDQIQSLLLLGSSGMMSVEERAKVQSEGNQRPIVWRLMDLEIMRFVLSYYTPTFFATQGLKASVFDQSLASAELANQFHELTLMEGSRRAIFTRLSTLEDTEDNLALSQEFPVPALIIHGEEDNIIPVQSSKNLAGYFKYHVLKLYPDIGHLPMYEAAESTAQDIDQFLDALF